MVTAFLDSDIAPFLAMAAEEGWVCGRWEFDFLLRHFAQGCLVWREGDRTLGYITSVRYGRSGWIGNLLVHPAARRQGIGKELLQAAISVLVNNRVQTVWLTASEKGAALYEQLGFAAVDRIRRWTGEGGGAELPAPVQPDKGFVKKIDRRGWGELRESLIEVTCDRGRLYSSPDGFICCQQWEDGLQIGPWGSLDPRQAGSLLDQALAGQGRRVFLDVPAGNGMATSLLRERGFSVKGETTLMYFGLPPLYQPEKVFALASMGSMG
jgi:ribosomal protein S18 acetylase RimI-like enzyme